MAGKIATFLAMSALLTSGVHSVQIISQNMEDITVKRGDESIMLCTADTEALACVFQSPTGQSFSMLKGAKYEDRIEQYGLKKEDCGLRITSVQDADNGLWTCTVTGKGVSGNFETGNGKIQVIVAIPPTTVHLEQDGQLVNGKINLNLDSGKQAYVDCVASGSRPAPEFIWYIGNEKIRANAVNSEAADDNGDIKYMSKLEYNADPKHNGQQLKCEVEHMGYSLQQITDQENFAEADLDLQFKPEEGGKAPEVFYGMQEGTEETIRIKFKANPKPTVGTWKIGETTVPIGASSVDSKFSSSQVNPAELQGDYQVELTFNMEEKLAGKPYTLEVTNDHGTTQYTFQLKLGEAPPPKSANAPVIGIVILVVIIILIAGITILARAKSMLCFKVKSRNDEDAERAVDKEGSDTESAEDTTAAKDDAKTSEEETKKDEKKSTGPTVVARMSNLFAAVKKSVKKPKENKYTAETPESEMKLHDNEEKKEGEDHVVYADLDKSALGSGTRPAVDNESTEYAEIRPQN